MGMSSIVVDCLLSTAGIWALIDGIWVPPTYHLMCFQELPENSIGNANSKPAFPRKACHPEMIPVLPGPHRALFPNQVCAQCSKQCHELGDCSLGPATSRQSLRDTVCHTTASLGDLLRQFCLLKEALFALFRASAVGSDLVPGPPVTPPLPIGHHYCIIIQGHCVSVSQDDRSLYLITIGDPGALFLSDSHVFSRSQVEAK